MRAGSRTGLFLLEGLNSFGASLYFNYLFFLLREEFHLSNGGGLAAAAMHGGVYMVMSRFAGRLPRPKAWIDAPFLSRRRFFYFKNFCHFGSKMWTYLMNCKF